MSRREFYLPPNVREIRHHQREREEVQRMARPPKHPPHLARVRDDGKGALALVMALSEPTERDGGARFTALTLKAGTTMDEAMALARAINEKLAAVEVIRL